MAPEFEEKLTDSETAVAPVAQATYQEIELRAYFRYMNRGGAEGSALGDWLAAEAEVQPTPPQQVPAVTRRRAARGAGEKQRTARAAAKPTRIGRSARSSAKPR